MQSRGVAAKGVGKAGINLETNEWLNASLIIPKSGPVSVHINFSGNSPSPNCQIFRGYVKGRLDFQETWLPPSGNMTLPVEGSDLQQRDKLFENLQVDEGEFLGIRVENLTPGFKLCVSGIYIRYLV